MWDQTPKSDLYDGISRAQRLAALLQSPAGDDLRYVFLQVCQGWFGRMMRGESGAHMGLMALNDFVGNCDLTITLAEGMKMELTKRQGDNDNAYVRATAE